MEKKKFAVINPIEDSSNPVGVLLLSLHDTAEQAALSARQADSILFPAASDVCKAVYRPNGFDAGAVGSSIRLEAADHLSSVSKLNNWQRNGFVARKSSLVSGWVEFDHA